MHDHPATPAVILAIDDETSVLDDLAAALSVAGYDLHRCTNPEQALEIAQRLTPDLIISDINLGGHNGLELCASLQEIEALEGTPVVFLSGAQIPDVIRQAHAAGGTYYLRKPFDPEVLLDLIDKALWMPHLVQGRLASRSSGAGV